MCSLTLSSGYHNITSRPEASSRSFNMAGKYKGIQEGILLR